MENPFIVGKIVTDSEALCPREKAHESLAREIRNHQSVYLVGERRVGKSSLVASLAKDLDKSEDLQMIYVDFRAVASQADVQKRMVSSIFKVASKIKDMDWFMNLFKKLKPTVEMSENGSPEVSLGIQESNYQDYFSLSEVFDFIEQTHRRHKCFVVFDEFQDIFLLGKKEGESIFGVMRSRIQMQKEISYVFLGSQRGSMTSIFEEYKSAFYHQAMRMNVERFKSEEIYSYVYGLFKKGDRVIGSGDFQTVYDFAHGITGDILKVCHRLWNKTKSGDVISRIMIEDVLNEIANENSSIYTDKTNQLTAIQRKFLRGFVLESSLGMQSKEFLKKYGIKSKDQVNNSVISLCDQSILYKYSGAYEFFDPFYRYWLRQVYKG